MRGAGTVSKTKARDFGAGQKCRVRVDDVRNWPCVFWPNDGAANGHVSRHEVLR